MRDFEKLGLFYLGRRYDLAARKGTDALVLYDSRDLVTHAVCVGMTGSGKTGLCLALLEEAALDGIPAVAIDPKGDLPNLLLTFPDLAPEDFLPWINPDEARNTRVTNEEYARQQADLWRRGLEEWGQDAARIRRLREAAEFLVYTPGSTAGIPVSVLSSFAAPSDAVLKDTELLANRIRTTTTGVLTLAGIDADPLRSREHILISTILDHAWRAGHDLEVGALIEQIQTPPAARIGVLETETFYPSRERFELAARLNNLLAAPGFAAWTEGEPIDVDRLLFTPDGRPKVSIISIAHLGDAERMFFVSLLLEQMVGWMRNQEGTSSLRAIFYMDEIAGYFPPVANPPSKPPLMILLKQARAFGLGVVLATQNPVDLDYKGLSNIGTWWLGRLQTERDKARMLDGLEGVAAGRESGFDRGAMEQTLAGLGKRVFLMHNVHETAPEVFETRWAMSYLRGPLTREQIRKLMAGRRPEFAAQKPAADHVHVQAAASPASTSPHAAPADTTSPRPLLPPDIPQYFLPVSRRFDAAPVYQPRLFASANVRFRDPSLDVDWSTEVAVVAPMEVGAIPVNWEEAVEVHLAPSDLERDPPAAGRYAELPPPATKAKSYEAWSREFGRWLTQTRKLELLRSARLGLTSRHDESERDFRIRLQVAAREARDQAVERLRQKYAPRLDAQAERVRRRKVAQARETEQASQQKLQTALSFGATVLGAFLGRKAASASTLGRATTAARGVGRSMKEAQDVQRAVESVKTEREKLADLEAALEADIAALEADDPRAEPLETVSVRPKKTDIAVRLVSLVWEGTG